MNEDRDERLRLGGRRFNAIGYQMRQLERRVRSLEERLAATNRPEEAEPRGGEEACASEKRRA